MKGARVAGPPEGVVKWALEIYDLDIDSKFIFNVNV